MTFGRAWKCRLAANVGDSDANAKMPATAIVIADFVSMNSPIHCTPIPDDSDSRRGSQIANTVRQCKMVAPLRAVDKTPECFSRIHDGEREAYRVHAADPAALLQGECAL
jgi:hypothetical protein